MNPKRHTTQHSTRYAVGAALLAVLLVLLGLATGVQPSAAQPAAQAVYPVDTSPVVVRTTDPLHLRAAPSTASAIYSTAPMGTEVVATGVSPSYRWLRTEFNGQGGWMSRQYVTVVSGDVASLPVTSDFVPPAIVSPRQYVPNETVVVAALHNVNMRLAPTTEIQTIEEIFDEEAGMVTVMPTAAQGSARAITADGLWVFVEYRGLRGWVYGQYLDVVSGSLDDLRPNVAYDQDGIFFAADNVSVLPGMCTQLRWSIQGDGSVHYKTNTVYGHGLSTECPTRPTQYKLIVVRPGNVIQERTITIGIINAEAEFTATTSQIIRGECLTLSWTTTAVDQVFINGTGVDVNASMEVCPIEDTDYNFRAIALDGGFIDKTISITVLQEAPTATPGAVVSINFYAENLFLSSGQCTRVHWAVTGANQVYYEGGEVGSNGSEEECPDNTATYRLRVFTTDNRTLEQTIVITVQ